MAVPAEWLLRRACDGVDLTQTGALSRSVVREAVDLFPSWWSTEVHGPPYREADVRVLAALHEGLRRSRLLRRQGRRLRTTKRGRELLSDGDRLGAALLADLDRGDEFEGAVWRLIVHELSARRPAEIDELCRAVLAPLERQGWRETGGAPPSPQGVSWAVGQVLCRAEAYGMVERVDGRGWAVTLGGHALDRRTPDAALGTVLVFAAELMNLRGVEARIAVASHQHLTAVHDVIQQAFGWLDDHLYSFWLDGRFWGDDEHEFTSPVTPDEAPRTADVPLAELDLGPGRRIAYVFDFGDEWRVMLTVESSGPADGGTYPRVVSRRGVAPPQYPDLGDEGRVIGPTR